EASTRQAECLLISSILFDLLKVLDLLNHPESKEERLIYHRLFIRFTVGQNFQPFAAENLRKFLLYKSKVNNRSEFWATYHAIRIKRFCIVATWAFASEEAEPVRKLRIFRNHTLGTNSIGRAFIRAYYNHGPSLVVMLR